MSTSSRPTSSTPSSSSGSGSVISRAGRHARRRRAPARRGRPRRRRQPPTGAARRAGGGTSRRRDRSRSARSSCRSPTCTGALTILVDHDMSISSAPRARTSTVLDFGHIIADGPTADVLNDPNGDGRLPRHRGGRMTSGGSLHVADLDVPRGERPVLRGVTLDIPAGEITTLLGPNGAGKSTLVLTIGGMLQPDRRFDHDRRHRPHRREARARSGPPASRWSRRVGVCSPASRVRRQPQGRHVLAAAGRGRGRDRLRPRAVPRDRAPVQHDRPVAVGRRAADGRAGAGAGIEAEGDCRRRALARAGPRHREAADARARAGRRARRRRCC